MINAVSSCRSCKTMSNNFYFYGHVTDSCQLGKMLSIIAGIPYIPFCDLAKVVIILIFHHSRTNLKFPWMKLEIFYHSII